MITVQEAVQKILKQSPFIEDAIQEGYVNLTALAIKIQPQVIKIVNKDVQKGAIVMAIKRYQPSLNAMKRQKDVSNYLQNMGDIIVRSGLIDFTFKNSETLMAQRLRLLDYIKNKPEIFHTASKGVFETNLITSATIAEPVEEIFKEEALINKVEQLASLTLRLPIDNYCVPGIYYIILKKIAWANINIVEIVSTTNEFTIILDEKDINKGFQILQELKSEEILT